MQIYFTTLSFELDKIVFSSSRYITAYGLKNYIGEIYF